MSEDLPVAEQDTLLSPNSTTSQQSSWPRPRSPIPPQRLAKLANALGIATPIPLMRSTSETNLVPSPVSVDVKRSLTPSAIRSPHLTVHPASSFQSKFLLHIIPPTHLPHDTNMADVLLTPPPSSASGYHTQFRRGTLVPFFPSFQAQLGAIAKEYALPSTVGMILYLVTSTSTPNASPSTSNASLRSGRSTPALDSLEEPGPRLTEDIWGHLWARVVRTELDSYASRSITPFNLNPHLSPVSSSSTTPLRPLTSATSKSPPFPFPTSSTSSTPTHYNASSSEPSQSEATTPSTSLPSESRADSLDLPGLHSPSLVPILAKVEFDIDKRKATWYGPWLRSRKHNYMKRGVRRATTDSDESDIRINLKLVDRQAVPRFLLPKEHAFEDDEPEYVPRTESPVEDEEELEDPNQPRRPRFSKKAPPPLTMPTNGSLNILLSASPSPQPNLNDQSNLPYRESDEDGEMPLQESSFDMRKRSPFEDRRGGTFFDALNLKFDFNDDEYDESDPSDRRRSQLHMKQKLDELERKLVILSPRKLKHEFEPEASHMSSSSTTRSSSAVRGHKLSPSSEHRRFLSASSTASGQTNLSSSEPPKWPAVPFSQVMQQNEGVETPADSEDFPPPPKFAINGVTNAIPLSPYKQSFSDAETAMPSEESAARRREHDEGHDPSYPAIVPPSLRSRISSESLNTPVIPLSPDPFGRFPSGSNSPVPPVPPLPPVPPVPPVPQIPTVSPKPTTTPVPPIPPLAPRTSESSANSSSTQSRTSRTAFSFESTPSEDALDRSGSISSVSERRSSAKLSSRFSVDSDEQHGSSAFVKAGRSPATANGASLNPVKSIRTLWRKSRKSSVSSLSPSAQVPSHAVPQLQGTPHLPSPNSPHLAPPPNANLAPPGMPRLSEEVVTNALIPPGRRPSVQQYSPDPATLTTAEAARRARGEQSINAIHFDQESPYPIRRMNPPSPSLQPVPQSPLPSPQPQSTMSEPSTPGVSTPGARKSILKTWRSNTNLSSAGMNDGQLGTDERELPASVTRKRRPSMVDMMRNSRTSSALHDAIPPSPMLPEQYARQTANGNGSGGWHSGGHATRRSSVSSQHSSPSSPPPIATPTVADSAEVASLIGHGKKSSLPYAYHELDN